MGHLITAFRKDKIVATEASIHAFGEDNRRAAKDLYEALGVPQFNNKVSGSGNSKKYTSRELKKAYVKVKEPYNKLFILECITNKADKIEFA